MTTLELQTKHAKILLGDTGELERIAALALVYPTQHAGWVVRAVASQADTDEVTGFICRRQSDGRAAGLARDRQAVAQR
jgi:phosphatidate phosphatase APP1